MKKDMKSLLGIVKVLFAGFLSLVIISLFTILYCNSGIHIMNKTGATDYKWEPYQLKSNMSEGFSWFHMDDDGFNNSIDHADNKINNLLLGSSHMEAVNIDATKNVGYLLNNMIQGYTYNIGMSGHQIYNCVKNMKQAIKQYNPTDYVILETDRVLLNEKEMQQVLDNSYPLIPSYDTGLLYLIQKYCPAVKHLYNQIDAWKNNNQTDTEATGEILLDDDYVETINRFIAKAANDATSCGARLIIFYHPQTKIDKNGRFINRTSEKAKILFKNTCDQNGVIFVDMTEDFETLYNTQCILAHGFVNTAVGTGHLNEFGHRIIAETIANVIKEESK